MCRSLPRVPHRGRLCDVLADAISVMCGAGYVLDWRRNPGFRRLDTEFMSRRTETGCRLNTRRLSIHGSICQKDGGGGGGLILAVH